MLTVTLRVVGRKEPITPAMYEHVLAAPSSSPPLQAIFKGLCQSVYIHPGSARLTAATTTLKNGKPFLLERALERGPRGKLILPGYNVEVVVTGWDEITEDAATRLQLAAESVGVQHRLHQLAKAYRVDKARIRLVDQHGKEIQ